MPVLRIVKEYNNRSPLSGIVQTDVLPFDSKEDGLNWLKAVNQLNQARKLDWDLIDYEWALIDTNNSEILHNPTGGFTGKLYKPDV